MSGSSDISTRDSERDARRIPRKYMRPRSTISFTALILGLLLGVGGGLYYAWYINPAAQVDIAPEQMDAGSQTRYMAAIALAYADDGDLNRAVNRLLALRLAGDPIQAVADAACSLAQTDYIASTGGLTAVRAMMHFYQLQGRTGCADQIVTIGALQPERTRGALIVQAGTPTLTPPASKTPTPEMDTTAAPLAVVETPTGASLSFPTAAVESEFALATISTFCDPAQSGIIEVFIYATNGASQLPGQMARVRWTGGERGAGESRFVTGLKPERGAGFADFQMESGIEYTLDLPGRAEPLSQSLSAIPCNSETGERALRSYRVAFRQVG
jgi:hypothetical protein